MLLMVEINPLTGYTYQQFVLWAFAAVVKVELSRICHLQAQANALARTLSGVRLSAHVDMGTPHHRPRHCLSRRHFVAGRVRGF